MDLFKGWTTARVLTITAVVIALLIITLVPSASGPSPPFSFAVGVGPRWLADAILNLVLFVPLGLALAWNSESPFPAVVCGLLLSIAVEIAQIKVPGRDPALSDIIFNTLGVTVGAFIGRGHRLWLAPNVAQSRTLTVLSVVTVGWVLIMTAVLLAPIQASDFAASRVGDDLVLRYPSRGSELGLDEPEYWASDAFSGSRGAHNSPASLLQDKARWQVTMWTGDRATLGPTVGKGWSLLAYPDAIGRHWSSVLDGLWILALCVPIGFWARGRLRLIAGITVIALLLLVPWLTGIVSTRTIEWAGAAIGFFLGSVLASPGTRASTMRPVQNRSERSDVARPT
ncbi:MAG TPA: VanZ family protein [Gemmatimonadaceae bacterium]